MTPSFTRWLKSAKAGLFGASRTRPRPLRLGLECLEDRAVPATHTWTDAGATNNWSDAGNWAGGVPTTGEAGGTIVVYNTTDATTVQNIAGLVIDQLRFDAGANITLTLNADLGVSGSVASNNIVDATGNNSIVGASSLVVQGSTVFIQTSAGAGQLTVATGIGGVGATGIRKLGPGTLTLSSAVANTYTGATIITDGVLVLNTNTIDAGLSSTIQVGDGTGAAGSAVLRLPNTFEIPDAASVTVSSDGLVDVLATGAEDVTTLTLGSGAGGGAVAIAAGGSFRIRPAGTVNSVAAPTSSTISGPGTFALQSTTAFTVPDGAAAQDLVIGAAVSGPAFGVTKTGPGTLTLSGWNTYTGATTVNVGTLVVNGAISGGAGVNAGTLGGSGTVGALATAGGTVAPGLGAAPAALAVGNLALAGATFAPVISGAGSDVLNVTGTVNLTGASLSAVRVGAAISPGQSFVLINNDAADAVAGTFAGFPQGATVTVDGQNFVISYTGGDGNDVTLTLSAPPPLPFYSNVMVIGTFLVLQGAGVQGGIQVLQVPLGTQALFADVNGDGKKDVVLFLPNLGLIVDGFTGRFLALSSDINGDGVRDLQVFNPDGTTTTTDGKTGRVTTI